VKHLYSIIIVIACSTIVVAQESVDIQKERNSAQKISNTSIRGQVVTARVIDGDTLPTVNLPIVMICDERQFVDAEARRRYYALKRNVEKVYPFAKLAGEKLKEYDRVLKTLNKRQQAKYMKKVEKEIKAEFGEELKDLTITQGRILIRLIDRETGDTSYYLVKELRSSFTAFFFQALARLFGHNLKTEYDPSQGEDKLIEEIVTNLEARS